MLSEAREPAARLRHPKFSRGQHHSSPHPRTCPKPVPERSSLRWAHADTAAPPEHPLRLPPGCGGLPRRGTAGCRKPSCSTWRRRWNRFLLFNLLEQIKYTRSFDYASWLFCRYT